MVGRSPVVAVVVGADAVLSGDESSGSVESVGAADTSVGGMITRRLFFPVISTSNCQRSPSSAVAVHVNTVSSAVDSGSSHSASEYRSSPAPSENFLP